jgi:hypothetical protein
LGSRKHIEFQKKISYKNGTANGVKSHQVRKLCSKQQQHLTRTSHKPSQNHELLEDDLMKSRKAQKA